MPAWLRHIADLFDLWLAWISGRKYDILQSRVGRESGIPSPGRPRFVLIQIDGLAHEFLLRAVAMRQVPTIARLIAQGYKLQRWRCGLPSSTPATQSGLMYGENWNIPAFRWYEKGTGIAPTCKTPFHAERLKARIAAGRQGILRGGSSYTNLLDGDARLALFTLSAMGRHRFFEHIRGIGWALLCVLMPWRTLRIVLLVIWELARDLARTLWLWGKSRFRRRLKLAKPVTQVLTNIIFGEIQTFGIVLDVYRGVPAIMANYYGYDEIAHTETPLAKESLRALRRIDRYIGHIDRIRRRFWPDTELYIFSDHGMSPAQPFMDLPGNKSLGTFVAENVQASVVGDEWREAPGWGNPDQAMPAESMRWLKDELDGIESHLSGRGRKLAHALRNRLDRRYPQPESGFDLARGSDVVVRASGSLAHLYFNVTPDRMDVSEIAILYPDLLAALVEHPGIGLVLGTESGRPVMLTPHGTVGLSTDHIAPGLVEPERACADLERLLSFPDSGDLVLLGAWDLHGRVVTFEDQAASHGGVGGPQDYPFFLIPPNVPLDAGGVTNASQLYPFFLARYHGAAEEGTPAPEPLVEAEPQSFF